MKVVFFGSSTSEFSNRHFIALLASPCAVVAAVDAPAGGPASTNKSGPTPNFVDEARARGITVYAPPKPGAPEFLETLQALKPDLLLAAGYTGIFKRALLAVPRLLTANFHASLLPAYRGLHPLFWALQHGEKRAGITVHLVDEGIDTGDILYQVPVDVGDGDTVSALYERVMEVSLPLVSNLIMDAANGALRPRPQGNEGASYYGRIPADLPPRSP
jgi:methionyl-tRNA formyltransferase